MATGVVFDESFTSFKCLWDDSHVEKPEKYEWVVRRCEELGLLERCNRLMARYDKNLIFGFVGFFIKTSYHGGVIKLP